MSDWIASYDPHTLFTEKAWLVLCWGAPAAGKSTIAREFCARHGLPRLSSDAVNQALIGDRFIAELRPAIYQGLLAMSEAILEKGGRLVLDGTFLDPAARAQVHQLCQRHGAVFVSLQVQCSLNERLRRNSLRSEAERVPQDWLMNAHCRAALGSQGELAVDTQRCQPEQCLQVLEAALESKLKRAHGLQRRRPAVLW